MTTATTGPDRLAKLDFARHNEANKELWKNFRAGTHTRVPMILGTNTRYFLFNEQANPAHVGFQDYIENPDTMFDSGLAMQRWSRFNLLQDAELGLPEAWTIGPDFQNFYEAAWFGCPIHYMDHQVPDTTPAFEDAPERVMEHGLPDPLGGIYARVLEYWQHFERRAEGASYLDRPIRINAPWCGLGTDGPMTVACNLFGPSFVCEAMLAEPERLQKLLTFITQATIARMKVWRQRAGIKIPMDEFGMADDSVALISTASYVEHILPHHRALYEAFGTSVGRGIHLCGNATRHFTTIRDRLLVKSFDTGFPVDFAALRKELGPDIRIQGGPHVDLLLRATPQQVFEESRRILTSGVLKGGKFVLREGNNLAPHTPLENCEAMYDACLKHGRTSP